MKSLTFIIVFLCVTLSSNSQDWTEVSLPFDYLPIFDVNRINDAVYISAFNEELGEKGDYANYKYFDNKLVQAEDDTIYRVLGKPQVIYQNKWRVFASCVNGIYLSDDSAETWSRLSEKNINTPLVNDVIINSSEIFILPNAFGNLLYRYNIENDEWIQVYENSGDTTSKFIIHQIESNESQIFALQKKVKNPWKTSETLTGGLFISSNGGVNWEKKLTDSSLVEIYVDEDVILVSTVFGNLLKSSDNGITWKVFKVNKPLYNFTQDGDRIIAGSSPNGIVVTYNLGESWLEVNDKIILSKIYKEGNNYFFKGNGNLGFIADSLFLEVNRINYTYNNATINKIYSINDTLFAVGEFERGVQYTTDLGSSWQSYYSQLEEEQIEVQHFYKENNNVFIKSGFGYYYSEDYGNTFVYNILPGNYSDILTTENKVFLYGTSGILVSSNYGKSFSQIDTTVIKRYYRVTKLADVGNEIIAFTTTEGIYKSVDEGESWKKLTDLLPVGKEFNSIYDFYGYNDNYFAVNTDPLAIFISEDKGNNWKELEIDLFDEINNFYIYMFDENQILISSYGSGLNGIRMTTNKGKTWYNVDEDLPKNEGNNKPYIILGEFQDNIYISKFSDETRGSDMYMTSIENLGIQSSIESSIERNYLYTFPPYPIPARNKVNILTYWDINLPMNDSDITVYDLNGSKVNTSDKLTLIKQADHKGLVVWDCSGVQAGIYIVSIKHGTEEKAVKVIVN